MLGAVHDTPVIDGLPFAARAGLIPGSAIDSSTSLLQGQSHDIVRFAMGSPAAEAIPAAAFDELARVALSDGASDAYDYGPTEGEAGLRAALLAFLEQQGSPTPDARLLITAGGMQGLDLAGKLFIERGDLVVVESPTYTNGTAVILSYEGELLEVPVDDDGMVVEDLPELVAAAGRTPKAIYVIPNSQNPSGTTLSLARRRTLLDLATGWGAVIVEDDPYGLLRFEGSPLPSLAELSDHDARVMGVYTFSKIVAPGLRVGWVVADALVVDRMIDAKQGMDTCTNVPAQRLLQLFLERGGMDDHLSGLRMEYRRRKEAMQDALRQQFGSAVEFTDPDGGFFLWLTFPEGVDTAELSPVALEEGVAYIPGAAFSPAGRFANQLRLCFASTAPERIREGVHRLRRAVDRLYGPEWSGRSQ
ncbi:MAG: PLP-dependent aminotransferase family protein [Thermoleophilaceae bacterium]